MSTFDKITRPLERFIKPISIAVVLFFSLGNVISAARDTENPRSTYQLDPFFSIIEYAFMGALTGIVYLFVLGWVLFLPTLFLCWIYDKAKG